MSRKLILGNKEKRFGRDSLGGASSATVVSSLLLLIVQGATTDDDMHNPLVLGLGRGRGTSHDGLENAMALLGFFHAFECQETPQCVDKSVRYRRCFNKTRCNFYDQHTF
ncbi:hypothetical protein AAZX31_18G174400 [Glycine max]